MLTTRFERYMFRLLQNPYPLTGNWHKKNNFGYKAINGFRKLTEGSCLQEWVALAWDSYGVNNGDTRDEQESAHIPYLVPGTGWEAVIKDFVRSTGVIKKEVHIDNEFISAIIFLKGVAN